jgi:diguanylate cyclase
MLRRSSMHRKARIGELWAAAAGFTAGVGVWATHFVAMTAYDPGMPTSFALGPLVSSFLISVGVQTFAFWQVAARSGETSEIKTRGVAPVAFGALSGLGIALMHFVGMSGLIASATFIWDRTMVLSAILLGCALGGAAIWLFYVRKRAAGRRCMPASVSPPRSARCTLPVCLR